MKPPRIVIAGGGTGGHLYPGIAVAREILRRRPEAIVTFAGTARGIEARGPCHLDWRQTNRRQHGNDRVVA